jgi:hypothetical protein
MAVYAARLRSTLLSAFKGNFRIQITVNLFESKLQIPNFKDLLVTQYQPLGSRDAAHFIKIVDFILTLRYDDDDDNSWD